MATSLAHSFLLLSCLLLTTIPLSSSEAEASRAKKIHLRFYIQQRYGGPKATEIVVVRPKNTTFGLIRVIDDELTAGPEPTSMSIGPVQGVVTRASMKKESDLIKVNYIFKTGKYKGSTLATFGRTRARGWFVNSILGGTGRMLLARGYVALKKMKATRPYTNLNSG